MPTIEEIANRHGGLPITDSIPPRPWAVVADPVRTSLHWMADANGEAVMRGDLTQQIAVERFIVATVNASAPVVHIEMDGGLIQDVKFEGGICTVIVRDYDTEGTTDETERDEGGEFIRSTYESADAGLSIPTADALRKSRLGDAAEDMLTALESLRDWSDQGGNEFTDRFESVMRAARAAIAKANGEEAGQ